MTAHTLTVRGDAVRAFLLTDLYESAQIGAEIAGDDPAHDFADDARAFAILEAGWNRETHRLTVQAGDLDFLAGYVTAALNATDEALTESVKYGRPWGAERRGIERGIMRGGESLSRQLWAAMRRAA